MKLIVENFPYLSCAQAGGTGTKMGGVLNPLGVEPRCIFSCQADEGGLSLWTLRINPGTSSSHRGHVQKFVIWRADG